MKLAEAIPSVKTSPYDYLKYQDAGSFFLSPVTSTEIENEIAALNSNKSIGPFSIPVKMLKLFKTSLSKPLEIIFNFSFSAGIVPCKFKIARVIPIYKSGSQTCMNNYIDQSH